MTILVRRRIEDKVFLLCLASCLRRQKNIYQPELKHTEDKGTEQAASPKADCG